jgi:aspartokinase
MSQPQGSSEVEFEKRRGISAVEVRTGFAQVHVSDLADPVRTSRLDVLRLVAEAGISIDFLKLAPFGISFLVAESAVDQLKRAFDGRGCKLTVSPGMGVVMVHAVNMRDEEGLVARIVSRAIGSGARIEHLGDMHDRLFIVSDLAGAKLIQDALQPVPQESSR